VAEVVRPALDAGRDVVTDRYIASSLAYQGFARGLSVPEVRQLSCWATGGLEPDLVVLLEVPESVAEARLRRPRDRMEAEGPTFHQAVADGYRTLAAAEPERWIVIDGAEPAELVAERVRSAVAERLGR
jgi:dTMP kinase